MNDDLVERTILVAARHFDATPIVLAYVYGSRAWGTPREASDLDLGYCLAPGAGPGRLPLRDELALADRLSAALGVDVDLRPLTDAPLALRGRVVERGRRVYCRDEVTRVAFESETLSRYHDYKPELEALRELRFASAAMRKG